MQSNREERDIQQALGSIPKVNNQRAFSCTVTIAGTGLGDITIADIQSALTSQHDIINAFSPGNFDQMYVHEVRAYGTAGGYLSMAPYPHRQYLNNLSGSAIWTNSYERSGSTEDTFRAGSLTQMYEFGINGATRPELVWKYPKDEIINNPFTLTVDIRGEGGSGQTGTSQQRVITLQSTNTGGNALYIVQFDVTVRRSDFIPIVSTLGAAAFGEKNVIIDNYLPPTDFKRKLEDAMKAEEQANKKRKVQSVKDLTLPALDSA